MSFALGFYEIFSYAIPGFLYILVLNGFLQLFKFPHIKLGQVPGTLGFIILAAILSYIAGHLADPLAYRWYKVFNRQGEYERAVARIAGMYPELNIGFKASDWRMLYSFIKHNDIYLAEYLTKFNAIGIMLQNLSLVLFLFALTQGAFIFITGQVLRYILGTLFGLFFSFIAIKRSAIFKSWYSQGIFEQALHYGTSVEKMFKEEWSVEKTPAPVEKPRGRGKTSKSKNSKTKTTKNKVN